MNYKYLFFIPAFLGVVMSMPAQERRLTMSKEEIEALKCDVVDNYYEFKKYVRVLSDNSTEPKSRMSNETALFRLLHPSFTMNDAKGGDRSIFIANLRSNLETSQNLKRTFENFDCPNVNLISRGVSPDPKGILAELKNMNFDIDESKPLLTTVYEGFMLFQQIDLNGYKVKDKNGIAKKDKIMRLRFQIFKVDEENKVIKIRSIDDVTRASVPTWVTKKKEGKNPVTTKKNDNNKFSIDTIIYSKPNPKDFKPCCEQRNPPDSDNDGYNDLVDCSPNDPLIHPGATEIIADGVDQNCDGVDQLGEDNDGDGYTTAACRSEDPEIRKKCDCNDDDRDIYRRKPNEPENRWYNPSNGWNDDNCDCKKDKDDVFRWDPLSSVDLLVPGKGHLIRGEKKGLRITRSVLYGGVFAASAVFGTASYIQTRKYYGRHLDAETFRETSLNYDLANKHHKRFLVATGISTLAFLGNYLHLTFLDNRERKYSEELYENNKAKPLDSREFCTFKVVPATDGGIGLALVMQF